MAKFVELSESDLNTVAGGDQERILPEQDAVAVLEPAIIATKSGE